MLQVSIQKTQFVQTRSQKCSGSEFHINGQAINK